MEEVEVMIHDQYNHVTKALIYDMLEEKYYGTSSYIIIQKSWISNFVNDFFQIVKDALEERYTVVFHKFGCFKVKLDKKTVSSNTVVFVSSSEINKAAKDSGNVEITLSDISDMLCDFFFKNGATEIHFPRKGLVEAIVMLLETIKNSLIEGKKVEISGLGFLYVETDRCYSSKNGQTRDRTRALLKADKEIVEKVNKLKDN